MSRKCTIVPEDIVVRYLEEHFKFGDLFNDMREEYLGMKAEADEDADRLFSGTVTAGEVNQVLQLVVQDLYHDPPLFEVEGEIINLREIEELLNLARPERNKTIPIFRELDYSYISDKSEATQKFNQFLSRSAKEEAWETLLKHEYED